MAENIRLRDKTMNLLVNPLLTDFYQISMVFAYWKDNRANDAAVFELFFRKNPFNGEFCIFAGLDEVLKHVESFRFLESDVAYLKELMPYADDAFFSWLLNLDCSEVKIYGMKQGQVVFPREPLLRLEGPIGITQLLETTLLNLVNFSSLVSTNAMRIKIAASSPRRRIIKEHELRAPELLEFGLRRAQGPDGALSATKYSYLGGFSGTSNVLAGKMIGIPVRGTHAHSFVMSYKSKEDLKSTTIRHPNGEIVEFYSLVLEKKALLGFSSQHGGSNEGELIAFTSYAQSNPTGFVALVDTYDTIKSGIPNFLAVGLALHELGYAPVGIRLDSGDLSYLSKEARALFINADKSLNEVIFSNCKIIASNDIDEKMVLTLNAEGHEVDILAVGTRLVTCYQQPALGCVYKLVEINGAPRIKLSQESEKVVIPSKKSVYRLIGNDNKPIIDIITREEEAPPTVNTRILCRHPSHESKRAYVTPSKVIKLLELVWDGKNGLVNPQCSIHEARDFCWSNIQSMREDHIRPMNATPYKVSLSDKLFDFFHEMIKSETPIAELA